MTVPAQVSSLIVRTRDGERILETPDQLVVGRDPAAGLTIADPGISRRHVRLFFDGGWMGEDLGSLNGTWIGGQRISRALVSGTTHIRLGEAPHAPTVSVVPGQPQVHTWAATSPQLPDQHAARHSVAWVIGRDPRCDIVLDELLVSRRHTRISPLAGGALAVEDLASANGTLATGSPWVARSCAPGSFSGSAVGRCAGTGNSSPGSTTARGSRSASVASTSGSRPAKALLDRVDVDLAAGSLTAVVGPSGAGKSTLFSVLTGARGTTAGAVTY